MKNFSATWLALILLGLGYIYSAFHVFSQSNLAGHADGQGTVLRLVHWQLEPGYREGLQWAMDEYNALPRNQAAGIQVQQQGVPAKVYGQFINIHMISGSGPDLAEHGKTELIKGNAVARYYQALSDYAGEPNPYNQPEYLPEGVSAEQAEFLSTAPWSETFIDGMKGGYDETLNDYYAVPISTFGGLRFFYNLRLVRQAKALLAEALAQAPRPAWLEAKLTGEANPDGILPDSPGLRAWLGNDAPPETFGQLLILCEAILAQAKATGAESLVPISGSSYRSNDPGEIAYGRAFMRHVGGEIDHNYDGSIDALELVSSWDQGAWAPEDDAVRELFRMKRAFAGYYPPGYLGLDREQAQRRFVQGNAMLLVTGGWDASSILNSVQQQRADNRFGIEITPAPLAAEGEIWHAYLSERASEAEFKSGAPFAINKQSPHKEIALDFLRFLTSARVNAELNRRAGWLPVVAGAQPVDHMRPFLPITEGLPPARTLDLMSEQLLMQIRNQAKGNAKLVVTGELSFEDFAQSYREMLENPHLGARRQWFEFWQKANDSTHSLDQSLNVEAVRQYLNGDGNALQRRKSRLYKALANDQGSWIRQHWKHLHPGEPFPTR